jgi:hypothetical protein
MLSLAFVLILSDLSSYSSKSAISTPNSYSIVLEDAQKLNLDILSKTSHQANHFNHSQQRNIVYVFVVLLALFIRLSSVIYHPMTIVISPPWFCLLRRSIKSRSSGWKESNLLYKAKLTYQIIFSY